MTTENKMTTFKYIKMGLVMFKLEPASILAQFLSLTAEVEKID